MNAADFFADISQSRADKYLRRASSTPKSVDIYLINQEISELFFGCVSHFEVLLRTRAHEVIAGKTGEYFWFERILERHKQGEYLERAVAESKKRCKKQEITAEDIIANLTLGFWNSLLGDARFMQPYMRGIFPDAKNARSAIRNITGINDLRNRVAHHESVFDRRPIQKIDYILSLIKDIRPKLPVWSDDIQRRKREIEALEEKMSVICV